MCCAVRKGVFLGVTVVGTEPGCDPKPWGARSERPVAGGGLSQLPLAKLQG